jgi:hypothetical protein
MVSMDVLKIAVLCCLDDLFYENSGMVRGARLEGFHVRFCEKVSGRSIDDSDNGDFYAALGELVKERRVREFSVHWKDDLESVEPASRWYAPVLS